MEYSPLSLSTSFLLIIHTAAAAASFSHYLISLAIIETLILDTLMITCSTRRTLFTGRDIIKTSHSMNDEPNPNRAYLSVQSYQIHPKSPKATIPLTLKSINALLHCHTHQQNLLSDR